MLFLEKQDSGQCICALNLLPLKDWMKDLNAADWIGAVLKSEGLASYYHLRKGWTCQWCEGLEVMPTAQGALER